jgi:hypothetical protein
MAVHPVALLVLLVVLTAEAAEAVQLLLPVVLAQSDLLA